MGYKNSSNSTCLLERGLIDGIMPKAQKGVKLTELQRELNNAISECAVDRAYLREYSRWFQESNVASELSAHIRVEYLGSYGIQSEAYAWASRAPEYQIVRESPP